jgi:hypothetical protein
MLVPLFSLSLIALENARKARPRWMLALRLLKTDRSQAKRAVADIAVYFLVSANTAPNGHLLAKVEQFSAFRREKRTNLLTGSARQPDDIIDTR